MSNNELWRDIKFVNNGKEYDYTGIYQISSKGRVKQLAYTDAKGNKRKEKIMQNKSDKDGYQFIALTKNYKRNYFKIHRLVAYMFIPNPENKTQVNHIDEDKLNNNIGNLEWSTPKENNNHGTRNKRIAKKLCKPVYCITNNTTYESALQAAEKLQLHHSNITSCCKGKYKSTGGYQFKYLQ